MTELLVERWRWLIMKMTMDVAQLLSESGHALREAWQRQVTDAQAFGCFPVYTYRVSLMSESIRNTQHGTIMRKKFDRYLIKYVSNWKEKKFLTCPWIGLWLRKRANLLVLFFRFHTHNFSLITSHRFDNADLQDVIDRRNP